MRSSHGQDNVVDPDIARIGPNKADISGMATGRNSDAENDKAGRPREGAIQPPPPRPHFATLNISNDTHNPVADRVIQANAQWHPDNANYLPAAAFEPVLADNGTVVYGWFAGLNGSWYPIIPCSVRRLSCYSGRVEAHGDDDQIILLANYGPGEEGERDARLYRARFAWYISEAQGFEIGE